MKQQGTDIRFFWPRASIPPSLHSSLSPLLSDPGFFPQLLSLGYPPPFALLPHLAPSPLLPVVAKLQEKVLKCVGAMLGLVFPPALAYTLRLLIMEAFICHGIYIYDIYCNFATFATLPTDTKLCHPLVTQWGGVPGAPSQDSELRTSSRLSVRW